MAMFLPFGVLFLDHLLKFFLELILPNVWAHPENMTCQISLGNQHVHGICGPFYGWALVPAWHNPPKTVPYYIGTFGVPGIKTDTTRRVLKVRPRLDLQKADVVSCYISAPMQDCWS
jgi:hypothetical protein